MQTVTPTTLVFKDINDIGVIWVMNEAVKLGFDSENKDWINLGQGEPETGNIKGAPDRITQFSIEPSDNRYGPLNGLLELRTAIAKYYNRIYRKYQTIQYTPDNVSIAMGGRLALTRIFSDIGNIRLGYKTPEYPAYEDLLNYQLGRIETVCIPTHKKNNYNLSVNEFKKSINRFQLDAFLLSNPCNPTGHVIKDEELQSYVRIANEQRCILIIDEIYSHYIYHHNKAANSPVSSASFIKDVNNDNVIIVDGLTKSFRYPGWRLAWIVGPTSIIKKIGCAASGIDGGPSLPIQRAAIQLFEPDRIDKETQALREVFSRKHNLMLRTLKQLGVICSNDAQSTFYIWADISKLPSPLNDAESFFNLALKYKVITVPGYLFDIHPREEKKEKNYKNYIRFSFGPEEEQVAIGLERITKLIQSYQ